MQNEITNVPATVAEIIPADASAPAADAAKPVPAKRAAKQPKPADKPAASKLRALLRVGKTDETKPAKSAKPAKPAADSKPADAPAPRGLTRDAIGIVRNATNFNELTDRDECYLEFFGSVARRHNGTATLQQLYNAGITRAGEKPNKRYIPQFDGSAKATDVGAYNRLKKAGLLTANKAGDTFTITEHGKTHKRYNAAKLAKA